jgi:hypothetical protein
MPADQAELDRAALRALLRELEPLRARVQELERRLGASERRVAELETQAHLESLRGRGAAE